MPITEVNFISSFKSVEDCPKTSLPEYAFIGRSNVGKSSLINLLTGRKKLAKVSSTPGKTQLINYFKVDESWFLVDLPGYGYAQISKKKREEWKKMIDAFLIERENLVCIFLLIDSRIPLQKIDLEFMNFLGASQLPFVLVFTKIDKVKGKGFEENIENIRQSMLEHWESLPQHFMTSATKKTGAKEIIEFIENLNNNS